MKFYEIDNTLQEAVTTGDKQVRVRIQIECNGHFESVFEQDIIEANFYGLKEAAGGITARGEILLDNQLGAYSFSNAGHGTQVNVSFSVGEGLPYFHRFTFYIDDKGIQDIKGPGRKRFVRIGLRDFSAVLRKTDEAKDWTTPVIFTYTVVCDKNQSEKSLLHCMALRAGLLEQDIECSTIPVTLPYVRHKRNLWAELSALATAYRCHLECTPDKRLVFTNSPYQSEEYANEDVSYIFAGSDIFYLQITDRRDKYRNTVRLKVNMPVSLERQEIWRYDDPPVLYDDFLQSHYPFRYPLTREIEMGKYEAKYRIKDSEGKEHNVIFADEIDTQTEAGNRLDYDGGGFSYSHYDVTTHHDRAILTLQKETDGDLYCATIHGRPIIYDLNRSCFMRESGEVERHGTVALNVTGQYFSDYGIEDEDGTIPHYEDWVMRELVERVENGREFTVKTHRALFHTRVGAKVKIKMKNEQLTGKVNAFSLRYKRDKAFVSTLRITEYGGKNE